MLEALIPFLVAFLSLVGGAVVYWWQKEQDRDADLVRTRHQAYRQYLAAQQKALTATIRTVHDQRRTAIDELRAVEMTLYVIAANNVVGHIAPLHEAFIGYTKAIRSRYEMGYSSKYRGIYDDLAEREQKYVAALKRMVQEMRRDSLDEGVSAGEFSFAISLASGERVKHPA